MLSLEHICVNKVLNISCEDCSDTKLLELRAMNYEQRITFFEENVICHPIAELLAIQYTVINDNILPIMEELYPWKLGSPNVTPYYEEIKRAMFNEDLTETMRLIKLLYDIENNVVSYVVTLITFTYILILQFKLLDNTYPLGIEAVKNKLLNPYLDDIPSFRIKMINLLDNLY